MRRLLFVLWSSLRLPHFLGPLLALTILPSFAAGLGVSPTLLEFSPAEVAKGLTLRNTGAATLRAQVRVFAWEQRDGKDVLEPSTALLASPPFLNIAPGASQMVRIIQRGGAAPDAANGERSFRILVDELPASAREDVRANTPSGAQPGLTFLLRFSIPAFIASDVNASDAELHWRLQNTETGLQLVTDNTGNSRAQISDMQLMSRDGQLLYEHKGLAGYVLSGNVRRWSFGLPSSAAAATEIRMQVNGQPTRYPLAPADVTD
ncbi:fimbrial biogenesis chaperone [Zhongshania marina]|uniref:Molecular chaperone n=1 Tax=Zhongshania marina TaxID=2304603 RepID=A0ABX9W6C5_9GAMM|nr:molecular chaperone [Zhongshania marina]